jgi:hypothetical protein
MIANPFYFLVSDLRQLMSMAIIMVIDISRGRTPGSATHRRIDDSSDIRRGG